MMGMGDLFKFVRELPSQVEHRQFLTLWKVTEEISDTGYVVVSSIAASWLMFGRETMVFKANASGEIVDFIDLFCEIEFWLSKVGHATTLASMVDEMTEPRGK